MAEAFDPYVKWLAIRDPRRPPDHYTLLGLRALEDDPDVISNAADQRMTHIRTFAAGRHSEHSQEILNALATARVCLLNTETKQPYDEKLRAAGQSTVEPIVAAVADPEPVVSIQVNPRPPAVQVVSRGESISTTYRQRKRTPTGLYITVIAGVAVTVAIVGMVMFIAPNTPEQPSISVVSDNAPANPLPSKPPSPRPSRESDVESPSAPEIANRPASDEQPTAPEMPSPEVADSTESETRETESPERSDSEPPSPREEMPADGSNDTDTPGTESPMDEPKSDDAAKALPPKPERLPVPNREQRAEAQKEIATLFGVDIRQATSPNARLLLAKKTVREARETTDPAVKFMLFELTRSLAGNLGSVEVALAAARDQAEHFAIDRLETEIDTIDQLMGATESRQRIYSLIHAVLQTQERAIRDERFPEAMQLIRRATTLAKRSGDLVVVSELKTNARDVRLMGDKFRQLQSVRDTLQADPADAGANFAIGKFKATVTGNWEAAIPLLLLGADPQWRAAAEFERDGPGNPQGQVQAGDAWWALAESIGGRNATSVRQRAAFWYDQALPSLADAEETRVRGRVAELFGDTTIWRTEPGNPANLGHVNANTLPRCTLELWFATRETDGTLIIKRQERTDSSLAILIDREAISAWAVGGRKVHARIASGPRVSDGRWHHAALVKERSSIRLYLDGQPVGASGGVASVFASEAPWVLGVNIMHAPHQTVIEAKYCRIRYSSVVRYRYPFTPRRDYKDDKATVFFK